MKFALLTTALLSLVSAAPEMEECNTKKMMFLFYTDRNCAMPHPTLNTAYSRPNQKDYELRCQDIEQARNSYKVHCDNQGIHTEVWNNNRCENASFATWNYQWDKCSPVIGQDNVWVIPKTKQEFDH